MALPYVPMYSFSFGDTVSNSLNQAWNRGLEAKMHDENLLHSKDILAESIRAALAQEAHNSRVQDHIEEMDPQHLELNRDIHALNERIQDYVEQGIPLPPEIVQEYARAGVDLSQMDRGTLVGFINALSNARAVGGHNARLSWEKELHDRTARALDAYFRFNQAHVNPVNPGGGRLETSGKPSWRDLFGFGSRGGAAADATAPSGISPYAPNSRFGRIPDNMPNPQRAHIDQAGRDFVSSLAQTGNPALLGAFQPYVQSMFDNRYDNNQSGAEGVFSSFGLQPQTQMGLMGRIRSDMRAQQAMGLPYPPAR